MRRCFISSGPRTEPRAIYALQGDPVQALDKFAGNVGANEDVLLVCSAHDLAVLAEIKAKWQVLQRDSDQSLVLLHEPERNNAQMLTWLEICAAENPSQIVFVCAEPQGWFAKRKYESTKRAAADNLKSQFPGLVVQSI